MQTARTITVAGAVKGSASFNGSGNVTINTTQANIAILTGTVTIAASSGEVGVTLNYPDGFTKDNCVVISFGSYYDVNKGYAFGFHSNSSAGMLRGTNDRDVFLNSSGIQIWYNNVSTSAIKLNYKIILMKVS